MSSEVIWLIMLPAFFYCVALVGIHSYFGLHVLKRGIIFVDLALAQIAALGTLIGFLFGIPLHTPYSYGFSLALTAVAAVIFTLSRFRKSKVPQEAIIGLVYAVAAAVAILLIDKAPHGAEHVKEIMTGSILWIKWNTVLLTLVFYSLIGLFHYICRRKFLLISENPEQAESAGINLRLWDFLFYLSFGFVITISVNTAGVLLVFVFLVAPAIMSMTITNKLFYQLIFGWIFGVIIVLLGLFISYIADLPTGPMVVAGYAVGLIIIAAIVYNLRAVNKVVSLRNTVMVTLFFAVVATGLFMAGKLLGRSTRMPACHHGESHGERPEKVKLSQEELLVELKSIRDITLLQQMFEQLPDPEKRSAVVCRVLEIDPVIGASLALEFLKKDPPFFFKQNVVDKLNSAINEPVNFDVSQPFSAPVNQRAIKKIKARYKLK